MSFPAPPKGYKGRKIEELLHAAQGSFTGEEVLYFDKCRGKVATPSTMNDAAMLVKGGVKKSGKAIVNMFTKIGEGVSEIIDEERATTAKNEANEEAMKEIKKLAENGKLEEIVSLLKTRPTE